MTWIDLYKKRNSDDRASVPLSWYVDDAHELQWVHEINIEKSARLMDSAALGFIIREKGPEHPDLCDNFKILTASNNGPMTDKIVSIKELMHCYENDVAFRTDSADKLDQLINHFFAHSIEESTEQLFIKSEPIAFWQAMAVITTEKSRQEAKDDLASDPERLEHWSTEFRVPQFIVSALIDTNYDLQLENLMDKYS